MTDWAKEAAKFGGQADAKDWASEAAKFGGAASQPQDQSWGDVAKSAAAEFVPSVGRMVGGIAQSVAHPLDTAKGLVDIAAGGLQHALPESLVNAVNALDPNAQAALEAQAKASQVGQFYKQRYGSEAGFKEALAKDPAGVMADLSSVLTGGGALASKLGLAKVGAGISRAGAAVDPLMLAAKGIKAGAQVAGKGAQAMLGMTTGAGSEAIKQAYQAGKTGGETAEQFTGNLRGQTPMQDVLDTAKADLQAMNAAKTAEYRANMNAIKADKTVLDFGGVDNALVDAFKTVTFKGQVKNAKGAQVVQQISDAIGDWKNLHPNEFHTPEGFDALKQVVGGIVEGIPFEEKTARMVGSSIYNAIKSEISKQAPVYSKTMKDYADATEQIREIERSLSLGQKAAADTSMRKLQSLMRNNVSTNYGQRMKLAQELEKQGGQIMPALAGQALSSITPRGLQGASTIPTSLLGYGVGGAPLAAAGLLAGSPRLAGEAAYASGVGARAASTAGEAANRLAELLNVNPRIAANILYQAQQPKQ